MKYGSFKYGQAKYGSLDSVWIYDRTSKDIEQRTAKAFFNYSDMNRLEKNAEYLSELLVENGYTSMIYSRTKTWDLQDIPRISHLEKIRGFVEKVIEIIPLNDKSINFPTTLNNMNYVMLNNLEKAMYVLSKSIKRMKKAYKYSGELYSGEE